MVASVIAENSLQTKFKILGIPDYFETMAHAPYLYHKFGFDVEGLENSMIEMINKRQKSYIKKFCSEIKILEDNVKLYKL